MINIITGLAQEQFDKLKHLITHQHKDPLEEVKQLLIHNFKRLNMTQAELKALLVADEAKVDTLTAGILALISKINSNPDVPQDIVDEANALDAKLSGAVADIPADAPTPPAAG